MSRGGVYPPRVATSLEGYTPSCVATPKIIVYPLLCRDTQGVYPSHGGYTPSCVATQKIIVYPLLCRDTGGVYPLLCRDTEDYRIPPAVSRHTGGYTPHARGIPPPVSRHRGLYPLCCMPPLCRDTWGVYPPHDTGLITRLCQADISTTRHTTPAQE